MSGKTIRDTASHRIARGKKPAVSVSVCIRSARRWRLCHRLSANFNSLLGAGRQIITWEFPTIGAEVDPHTQESCQKKATF